MLICDQRMLPAVSRTAVLIVGILAASLCLYPQTTPVKDVHANEPQGIPARATPGDYQQHTQAGSVTIAAEFIGHFVPTSENTLTTEDYVIVETALFGGPDAKLTIASEDFSIRINGKKTSIPSETYVRVASSLKDPDWEPPDAAARKSSKTSLGTGAGAGGAQDNSPPPPVHVPIELQRAMAQRTQKAALAEGERPLPQAGLLFFPYRGKGKDIHSVELIYSGSAGKATLALQP